MFQSTPPRGGRLITGKGVARLYTVSIHAPARGATCPGLLLGWFSCVSIHAPARGATKWILHKLRKLFRFNPRPRAGGDVCMFFPVASHGSFNPRPRAGGDQGCSRLTSSYTCFNPRPRAGGDPTEVVLRHSQKFQSTPPRGGRRLIRFRLRPTPCFNPRPRAGGDIFPSALKSPLCGFQSTPPRGGRRWLHLTPSQLINVSIHAPARGATLYLLNIPTVQVSFNPRPRAGGDHVGNEARTDGYVSIHAPARGATDIA